MKNLLVLSILILFSFTQCTKEMELQTINWQVGESLAEYNNSLSSNKATLKFEMTNESFCVGSAYINVDIKAKGVSLIHENVFHFPYSKELSVKAGDNVTIHTEVISDTPADTVCVRLGNVNCKLEY